MEPKTNQRTHTFKTSQNLKKLDLGAQWFEFNVLEGPFGHPFFIKFRNRPNLLNCNKHDVKTLLLLFQASHFGIENQLKKFMFFQDAIQDPIFTHFI